MWQGGTIITLFATTSGGCSQRLTQPQLWIHNGVPVDWVQDQAWAIGLERSKSTLMGLEGRAVLTPG
eukprot:9033004-Karenia_brevis.AAC.1